MKETMRARSRVSTAAAGVVVAVAAVIFVAVFTVGSSPRVCGNCHGPQSSALASSAHANVNCYGCHIDNGAWGFAEQKTIELTRMYPAALFGSGFSEPARTTGRAACLQCHSAVLRGVVGSNGLRIKHAVCAPGVTCDDCHAALSHATAVRWESRPVMEECTACHERAGGPTACDTCHDRDRVDRTNEQGPWQVTHGTNWRATHGMGDQKSCRSCHPDGFCSKCHSVPIPHTPDFGASHGALAMQNLSACLVCHKSEKTFCDGCHGMPMPHPSGFLKRHDAGLSDKADARCLRCHSASDCDDCHANHVHPGAASGVPVPWIITPESLRP